MSHLVAMKTQNLTMAVSYSFVGIILTTHDCQLISFAGCLPLLLLWSFINACILRRGRIDCITFVLQFFSVLIFQERLIELFMARVENVGRDRHECSSACVRSVWCICADYHSAKKCSLSCPHSL
jgi:hypothetical protein